MPSRFKTLRLNRRSPIKTSQLAPRNSQGVSAYFDAVGTVVWNETTRGCSFHSKPFLSILNFQATEQPTRTEKNNPTDFCGGTAQLDPKTGVPSRGQRVLSTENDFAFQYIAGQASEQAVLAIQGALSGEV